MKVMYINMEEMRTLKAQCILKHLYYFLNSVIFTHDQTTFYLFIKVGGDNLDSE